MLTDERRVTTAQLRVASNNLHRLTNKWMVTLYEIANLRLDGTHRVVLLQAGADTSHTVVKTGNRWFRRERVEYHYLHKVALYLDLNGRVAPQQTMAIVVDTDWESW